MDTLGLKDNYLEADLKWLNRYECQEGEEAPIGLILCATASREKIELLEMDKSGIAVAEFWTHLPPKAEFEAKIKTILIEAKERLERRKLLPNREIQKQIEYFYEAKDGDTEDDLPDKRLNDRYWKIVKQHFKHAPKNAACHPK